MLDEVCQIAEVTDAPVVLASQRVKLDARSPDLLAVLDCVRLVALHRSNDERALGKRVAIPDELDGVVAQDCRNGNLQLVLEIVLTVYELLLDRLLVVEGNLSLKRSTGCILKLNAVLELALALALGNAETDFYGSLDSLADPFYINRLKRSSPFKFLFRRNLLCKLIRVVNRVPHGLQNKFLAFLTDFCGLAPGISIALSDLFLRRQFLY